jgi:phage head maturation protease
MEIEHKAVGVTGVKKMGAGDDGLVRAFVSVTGLKDNVNDIIEPGAYEKSLNARTPKGVWHHNWHESVSRTEAIKELAPGDPELPKTLPNGSEWPKEAGALRVDTRFNLKTQRGREAYEDVLFFGDQQEWSIGYNVPVGGATIDSKSGVRRIHTLDLYEYSPVLFGAMPVARTGSVKEAQTVLQEVKSLHGDDAYTFLLEIKSVLGDEAFEAKSPDKPNQDEEDEEIDDESPQGLPDLEEDEEDWEDDEDDDEEKGLPMAAAHTDAIRQAIRSLQALLPDVDEDAQEEKAHMPMGQHDQHEVERKEMFFESKDLPEMLENLDLDDDVLLEKAAAFEDAVDSGDVALMEAHASPVLDFVEAMIEFDANEDEAKAIAGYIAEQFKAVTEDSEDPDAPADDPDLPEEPAGEPAEPVEEAKSFDPGIETKTLDLDVLARVLSDD